MDEDNLRELQATFLAEGQSIAEELESALLELEKGRNDPAHLNLIFRLAHNFKGSSRSVGLTALADLAHKMEDVLTGLKSGKIPVSGQVVSALLHSLDALGQGLDAARAGENSFAAGPEAIVELMQIMNDASAVAAPPADAGFGFFDEEPTKETGGQAHNFQELPNTKVVAPAAGVTAPNPTKTDNSRVVADELVRVPAARLDALVNFVGELVVNRAIIDEHRNKGTITSLQATRTLAYMSKLIGDVQTIALGVRLVEVKPLFHKLRRAVRDVAAQIGRNLEFVAEGEHVELDKSVLDKMSDPLTHMVRNAVDHGIEAEDKRVAAGKAAQGTIRVSALSQEDRVQIIVQDDGGGLDKDKILAKAVSRGLIAANRNLTDGQIFALIFLPGFSTKEAVTDISGRGVGMEVVQKAVEELKGTIDIESKLGVGTKFTISLPLTLSIIGGMVVEANRRRFVLPVSQLVETIDLSKLSIETTATSGQMINLRGEVLPVYSLANLLARGSQKIATKSVESGVRRPAVLAVHRGRKVTFEVDAIISQQQVVLKKLGAQFQGLPGIVAGAILSDGEPGLVLNLHELIPSGGHHAA